MAKGATAQRRANDGLQGAGVTDWKNQENEAQNLERDVRKLWFRLGANCGYRLGIQRVQSMWLDMIAHPDEKVAADMWAADVWPSESLLLEIEADRLLDELEAKP